LILKSNIYSIVSDSALILFIIYICVSNLVLKY